MPTTIQLRCEWCGAPVVRLLASWKKTGPHAFCDRKCFSANRVIERTVAQKKADKAAYDREYRVKNRRRIKRRKAEHFQRTYDPEKAAIDRQKRMPRHIEYCRQPEYRKWKKKYDSGYRAKKHFGEFADCAELLAKLEKTVAARMTDYEIRLNQGTLNKIQKRKRALYAQTKRQR